MPLRKTVFFNQGYYHIYNRGSEKRRIFLSNRDYQKFLSKILENLPKFDTVLLCYYLMPNHYHLLLKQNSVASIAGFINVIQLGYAKYFNTKYDRVGPLFQGRFKSKLIDSDEYLLQLSAYIHKNPLALKSSAAEDPRNIHQRIADYPYSSYAEYVNIRAPVYCKPEFIRDYFSQTNINLSYQSFVCGYVPDEQMLALLIDTV